MNFYLTPWHCLVLKTCRIYIIFDSGANCGIHAQFMAQASSFDNGKRLVFHKELAQGLLLGFIPCIDCYIWKSHWRQQFVVLHCKEWSSGSSSGGNWRWSLWRAKFCLLGDFIPALKALTFCYSNHPATDKIYFLVHCADCAMKKSSSMLDNGCLFNSSSSYLLWKAVMRCWMKSLGNQRKVILMKGKSNSQSVPCSHSFLMNFSFVRQWQWMWWTSRI